MENLRVLVIEDNALVAMTLVQFLISMGHDVCATASTEAEAVIAAIHHRPDLMIVDGDLAPGSGVSAVEQIILRLGPSAHVFVSGDYRKITDRLPGAQVLRKPFRIAELASAIESALCRTRNGN